MSLPASQQRALDAIDSELRGADARLARMFSVFTELTRQEKMPPAETFQPVRWWTRAGRRAARRQRGCTLPGCRRPGHQGQGWRWAGQPLSGGRPASRLGAIVLLPLLLAATLSLLLLTMLTTRPTGSGRCAGTTSFMAPVRLAVTGACAPGGQRRTSPADG
jgi:hypothetical protein